MRIAIYGGSFDPPHAGHVSAAEDAVRALSPDKLFIIPAREPPHKALSPDSPGGEERLELCRLAFGHISCAEISHMELRRPGASYTVDTLRALGEAYPEAELTLLMGTDMLCAFEEWKDFREILSMARLAVFARADGEDARLTAAAQALHERYGAEIQRIPHTPLPASSTELREALRAREGSRMVPGAVYEEIIRRRFYGAKPALLWLREQAYPYLKPKRVPHVRGTEQEAVHLAERWGADPGDAAEAAILHDMTKKLELDAQLILCDKYGIINDTAENGSGKLLHAKTGAALARDRFGVTDAVYDAIRWHTTGRADMSLLETVIYMADYIEPNRDFPGLTELRELAYSDLNRAMVMGLEMSMSDLRERGIEPHESSAAALRYFRSRL